MRIVFDFEKDFTEDQLKELYKGQTGVIVSKTKEFVSQRLKIFEEETALLPDAYVMVCFMDEKAQLRFYGVSEELGNKMNNSISQEDFDYVMRLIWDVIYPGTIPPTN
jgi:hypothetical protein